jgi:NitT/TauT family transport system substrate-binding protein
MTRFRLFAAATMLAVITLGGAATAQAETKEVRMSRQFGLNYLALDVMRDQQLIEKHCKEAGLGDVKADWVQLAGPAAMNDALLSGSLDFATGGVPALTTLWSKTKGTPLEVRCIGALGNMPNVFYTTTPNVKTAKDFTDKDKIAVTSVKVSTQAIFTEMFAMQAFGEKGFDKLNSQTVSLSHPDSTAALLSGGSDVTAYWSSPPFLYKLAKAPGIFVVTDSYKMFGGPVTFNLVWCTSKFRTENPKTFAAVVKAFREATAIINKDKKAAAELYVKLNPKENLEETIMIMNDPRITFDNNLNGVLPVSNHMAKTGRIPKAPDSVKDLLFPEVQDLTGN